MMPDEPLNASNTSVAGDPAPPSAKRVLSAEELEEQRLIRRHQLMMNMVMNVIAQDGSLSVEEASQMIADARGATLAMFPGKELAYDLIWKPRFQRLMQDRFRLN